MAHYVKSPSYKTIPHFAGVTPYSLRAYTPVLAFWGAAAVWGIFTFTELVPVFQQTFYQKIPYFGQHWIKELDPQDSPQ